MKEFMPVLYRIISILIALADITLAGKSIHKKGNIGKYLAYACFGAAVVNLSYLVSIFHDNYFIVSLASSIYFASIDWTVVALLIFTGYFTKHSVKKTDRFIRGFVLWYLAFDTIVFLINPFYEIAISYVHRDTLFARYSYHMMPLYRMHLIYIYLLIVLVLLLLIHKVFHVPLDYRKQYWFAILGIIAAVLMNAVFLFLPGSSIYNMLDYSICGYSVTAFILYWTCFAYSSHGMLNHFRNKIFENIEQGIALFDYDNNLILHNQVVCRMIPEFHLDEDFTLQAFIDSCGILPQINDTEKSYTFQCYVNNGTKQKPLRCNYRLLENKRGEKLGQLFVLSDATLETDVLTGFHNWDNFQRFAQQSPFTFGHPTAVAVCDINGLKTINTSLGHNRGDQALQLLAQKIREFFPKDSYFIRQEANLIAICHHTQEMDVLNYLLDVQSKYEWNIQFAAGMTNEDSPDILEAISSAQQAMQAKKLLNQQSCRSELLTSLVTTLQECDSDTKAHVQRTQQSGAKLGIRLGLTDLEHSNLSLLCLLHDIGKIGIPLEILNKPGKLSDAEWNVMKTHVEKGFQIANNIQELKGIADMILHHHERWDGKGYPDGLSRESIPLLSRIISVVDSFDAMTNDRSYRPAMSIESAAAELRRCAGTQFDPAIVSEFLQMLQEESPSLAASIEEPPAQIPASSPVMEQMAQPEPVQQSNIHALSYSRYLLDEKMTIIKIDDAFEQMTGYTQQDIEKGELHQADLIFPEERVDYFCIINEHLARSPMAYFEHRIRRKDGSAIYVFCYGKNYYDSAERSGRSEIIIVDSSTTYSVKSLVEVEAAKAQNRLKRWESMYRLDSLTGLLNHEAFKNDVEARLLKGNVTVMMLMMDVDKFKEYNDTFGHRAGDEFLILTAQALTSSMKSEDLACRMGEDEFAAALFFSKSISTDIMYERAQQIFDRVNMTLSSTKGGTSLSMGAAISGKDICTFNQLYEASDKALYQSKTNGRAQLSTSGTNS